MPEISKRDQNRVTTAMGVTNDANLEPRNLRVDPETNRLLVSVAGGVSGSFITVDKKTVTVTSGLITEIADL